jgi:hypothetical protein
MKEIMLDTKIADLLNDYEGMKDILISINPKFKKLNNPVLRRTLAKLAGVKQAAIVGGMEPMDLLNQLRVAVGQEPLSSSSDEQTQPQTKEAPEWIKNEPLEVLNANALLDSEENPLAKANLILVKGNVGDIVALKSDFLPQPLIDEFEKKGYEVYCQEKSSSEYITYVKKA